MKMEPQDPTDAPNGAAERVDDLLDALVAEYSDEIAAGRAPDRRAFLARAPAAARPGLERCLKMLDAGTAATSGAPAPLASGVAIDNYELLRELGRGGMAVVWLARDRALRRPAALKFLRPGLAFEQRHVDRFRREALAIAKLKHPNIVGVYGVGEALGHHYIAMEFIEGPSLATVLEALPDARQRTPEELARAVGAPAVAAGAARFEEALARLLAPVAKALAAAHAHGLVHRDVKPSNILLRADGTAVVCDFGLAKAGEDPSLSLSGEPLGTPYYMSPEQAVFSGCKVDHRTDVYSLGVTLYEALAGERPFGGSTALEVMDAIRTQMPRPLSGARATRDAQAVVRKAMARDPEGRYATADELHTDLLALASGAATRARQLEGGTLRRCWTEFRLATSGQMYEYRSARSLLGRPLLHVYGGARMPGAPRRIARGWVAIGGERAHGLFLAMAPTAYGLIAFGGFAAGGFTSAGAGIGLVTFNGIGLGLISFCGVSTGYLAIGGIALGWAALGGLAIGRYAMGGSAHGTYVLGEERQDAEVEAFLTDLLPGFLHSWFGL